jgi:hypothetical protein
MSELSRKKMIRLAFEQPELRKHLLPMLKEGRWGRGVQYVPDDPSSLGFRGVNSESEALRVGALVEQANAEIRKAAHATFVQLGTALRHMDSDVDPGLARAAVGIAYQDIFLNLADEGLTYFKRLP